MPGSFELSENALVKASSALQLIAQYGCETFWGDSHCRQEFSGRSRGAEYGADAWCDACVAIDAIGFDPSGRSGIKAVDARRDAKLELLDDFRALLLKSQQESWTVSDLVELIENNEHDLKRRL